MIVEVCLENKDIETIRRVIDHLDNCDDVSGNVRAEFINLIARFSIYSLENRYTFGDLVKKYFTGPVRPEQGPPEDYTKLPIRRIKK